MVLFGTQTVSMDSGHAELLIGEIVKRVVATTKDSKLEELRSLVRLETDLAETRRLSAIKDGEIANLRAYIEQLQGTIRTMAPASGSSNHAYVAPSAPAPTVSTLPTI